MSELKKHFYDEKNGFHYTLVGSYYLPDIQLSDEGTVLKEMIYN